METYIQELKTDDNYSSNYSTGKRDSQGNIVADTQTQETTETQEISVTEEGIPVIEGTGEILVDVSSTGRVRNWSEKKRMNEELVKIFERARLIDRDIITGSRLNQLEECGSYLRFAETAEGRKLVEANFCRVRLCPLCQWRRSLKLFSQVSEITDYILSEKKVRFLFVTLTVRNCEGEDLPSTLDRMNEGFKLLVRKKMTLAETKPLSENLLGYMKAIEVTYNIKTKRYHPHIHCVFEVKPSYFGKDYIKHSQWIEIWKRVMRLDYEPSVSIKAIKDSSSKAVAEVAKYPVKLDGLFKIKDKNEQSRVLIVMKRALHKRRLLTFGGDFREVKRKLKLEDVETTNDLIHLDNEERELNIIAFTIFKYRADFGCYVC